VAYTKRNKPTLCTLVDRAIGQFQQRLASITAVKGGHVEHSVQVFHVTTLHCNDWG